MCCIKSYISVAKIKIPTLVSLQWRTILQPLLQLKSNKYYLFRVCVCILHAVRLRHVVICGLFGLNIFLTLSHKWYNFLKVKSLIIKCAFFFIFSTTSVWNISHSKTNSLRYYHRCAYVFRWSICYSWQTLMKLEFSRQILEKKFVNTKFHKNLSSGSRVVPCGWVGPTEKHDEANRRFSQLCEKLLTRNNTQISMKIRVRCS